MEKRRWTKARTSTTHSGFQSHRLSTYKSERAQNPVGVILKQHNNRKIHLSNEDSVKSTANAALSVSLLCNRMSWKVTQHAFPILFQIFKVPDQGIQIAFRDQSGHLPKKERTQPPKKRSSREQKKSAKKVKFNSTQAQSQKEPRVATPLIRVHQSPNFST